MRRSHIDFARPSALRALRLVGPMTRLALAAGIIACAGAGFASYTLLAQADARALEIQGLQQRIEARTRPAPRRIEPISAAQAKAVNDIVARLNLPWRDVFQAIEAATPSGIALLELAPDAERNALKGTAEAKNSDEMLAYIERLAQQRFFSAVQLTRHELNEQEPMRPIRFQFQAEWERKAN
jgi:Tfp pilus assembly protein PilN